MQRRCASDAERHFDSWRHEDGGWRGIVKLLCLSVPSVCSRPPPAGPSRASRKHTCTATPLLHNSAAGMAHGVVGPFRPRGPGPGAGTSVGRRGAGLGKQKGHGALIGQKPSSQGRPPKLRGALPRGQRSAAHRLRLLLCASSVHRNVKPPFSLRHSVILSQKLYVDPRTHAAARRGAVNLSNQAAECTEFVVIGFSH